MNKIILAGRLTKDPELRTTPNGVSVCSFTVAVNRRFRNADGEYEADFINCVAWRQSAEYLCKYHTKGDMVGVVGSIQTRNYEKDGQRIYITEVAADEIYSFGKSNKENEQTESEDATGNIDFSDFAQMPADDDLPF